MYLSINPTYFCNFRCDFCYLSREQLNDKTTLSLEVLEQRLQELTSYTNITHVDLYGGEVCLLPTQYMYDLKKLIQKYCSNIHIITNLSLINDIIKNPDIEISVSFDFRCREQSERVLKNILLLNRQVNILLLVSECMLQQNIPDMIETLNNISNVASVNIKPYSSNQGNQQIVQFNEFEEFVKQWIIYPDKRFILVNEQSIQDSLNHQYSSFSDNHIYITPTGEFAVLEFDLNDNEFFLKLNSFEEYIQWTKKEKQQVYNNKFCKSCEYTGHCLSEHLRVVTNMTNSCNGFKTLLDWYKYERMETKTNNIS